MSHPNMAAGLIAAAVLFSGNWAEAADLTPPPEESGWTFTAAPYLWASGLEGETGVFGLPAQDIDISFSDVLQHLDFGFMGAAGARNGRFSLGADIVYAKLSADIDTPHGIIASNIDGTVKSFMGTALAGYSVIYDDALTVDLVAGARLWSVDNDFHFNGGVLDGTSVSDGDTWVDPVVGTKFNASLGSDFYIAGWGLVGGFGVSSDIMWDVMAGLGYQITGSVSLFAGYRAADVDFRDGGFVYNVTQKGPLLGGVIRF
jgi:hypothetical protein